MISVKQAKEILQHQIPSKRVGKVSLRDAAGLVCGEDIFSPIDVPTFDNSAMDGYAIAWEQGIQSWELEGEIAAGAKEASPFVEGKAVRIFTGAPIPEGADTVIQQEWVTISGNTISLHNQVPEKGMHVRKKGAQTRIGDCILPKGTFITPGGIGLLASVGMTQISVFLPPRVTVIITGSEIKEVGETLEHGQIYNANGPVLETYLRQEGIQEMNFISVEDHAVSVQEAIQTALSNTDLVLLSGGISVGDYDFVKEGLEKEGVLELFYKIKQKPGKPIFAGIKGQQLIFALPGNPASVITCFNQYVKPAIHQWMGKKADWESKTFLPLASPVKKSPNLTFFLKVKIADNQVQILPGQESFNLIAFAQADGFTEIPEGVDFLDAGEQVAIYLW
ncbi:molybdopterin molybdotransferase MoeA [Mongoliitalea daihaiensis]|uniref:molybdopterin molybdotransferase MoeA n=1 Tax=Mongoliitalea daihaiensis TaxID=2782006 RepID=UPI001F2F8300|nr:gephyrin-like molybdotransferase Glp [Mongoliitalea daihaiensis]UJP63598.1 molybdopterin molybdotransferase MoeA [Mongoliitalea daihaiensis]